MSVKSARIWKRFAIAILSLAVIYAILLIASSRSLRKAYLALEQDGRPMRAEQIIPAEVPDADNASLLYQAAVLRLKAETVGSTNLFKRLGDLADALLKGTVHDPERDELRLLLASAPVQSSLQLLREGTGRPSCRYPLDYTKGPGILLLHVSDLRRFSRILCAQSRLQKEAGDPPAAWDTALVSLRLATALEKEPVLISQLVRAAQLRLSIDTIRELARQALPSDPQSATINELLSRFGDMRPIVLAMDGERLLMGEWCFSRPAKDFLFSVNDLGMQCGSGSNIPWPLLLLNYSPTWGHDHAAYLQVLHRYAQLAEAPYLQTDNDAEETMLRGIPWYCVLTRLLVPGIGSCKTRFVNASAEARITQAGLAVLRHHQSTGRWPDSLAAAGAGGFTDPFTGKPLLYKATGDGVTIYSVGPDMKDDGGSIEKGAYDKPRDLVWRF